MLTRKEFELFAEFLGNYVIPELLTKVEQFGVINWDMRSIEGFYRVEQYLVKKFNENPRFNIDRFNERMLGYAEEQLRERNLHHMILGLPGMKLLQEREAPTLTIYCPYEPGQGE